MPNNTSLKFFTYLFLGSFLLLNCKKSSISSTDCKNISTWNMFTTNFKTIENQQFISDNLGFLSGKSQNGNYTILKTIDGGKTFMEIPFKSDNYIGAIHFLDENTGIIEVDYDGIYRTTDVGKTWTKLINDIATRKFNFVDNKTGYFTSHEYIFSTNDGGKTWLKIKPTFDYIPSGNLISYDLKFISKTTGFIGLSGGLIYKTNNSGQSWKRVADNSDLSNSFNYIQSFTFTDDKTGFAVGSRNYIGGKNIKFFLQTNDAGETWNKMNLPDNNLSPCKIVAVKNNLYALFTNHWSSTSNLSYKLFYSADLGKTWSIVKEESEDTYAFEITSNCNLYLSTLDGKLIKGNK